MSKSDKIIQSVKSGDISLKEALEMLEGQTNKIQSKANNNQSKKTSDSKKQSENDEISIFIGLDKLDKESLRFQIATLEMMTLKNVFGEQGQKVVNFSKKIFGSDQLEKSQVGILQSRIKHRAMELDSKTIMELQRLLRKVLAKKVKSAGESLTANPTDYQLSRSVIEAATKYFNNIKEELSLKEKADQIQILYHQQLQQQTSQMMDKQSLSEQSETEEALQKELDKMTPQQAQELRKALNIESLTGETVRNALRTGGSGTAAMIALNSAGFGGYVALTTIMHAVFTTTLGITLPFAAYTSATSVLSFITGPAGWLLIGGSQAWMMNKNKNKLIHQLLAQVVWLSVQGNGEFYSETTSSDLPEFMADMERDNKQFLKMKQKN